MVWARACVRLSTNYLVGVASPRLVRLWVSRSQRLRQRLGQRLEQVERYEMDRLEESFDRAVEEESVTFEADFRGSRAWAVGDAKAGC